MPQKLLAALAATALAVPALFACDLVESAQANKVMAASLLATGEYELSGNIPDAGVSVPDGGIPTALPAQTVAQVFFGNQSAVEATAEPSGVPGAKVTLSFSGKNFELKDKGGGNYALSTLEDSKFVYASGAEYTLTVVHEGVTYTGTVTGPAEEKIAQFEAAKGKPLEIEANKQLELTRSSTENIAFTTVFPIGQNGKGEPTYTDMPSEPLDLIDLVANPAKWKKQVITIEPKAFPQKDTNYLINVSAVSKGTTSNNLFTTSVFLAGTAEMGMAKTKP